MLRQGPLGQLRLIRRNFVQFIWSVCNRHTSQALSSHVINSPFEKVLEKIFEEVLPNYPGKCWKDCQLFSVVILLKKIQLVYCPLYNCHRFRIRATWNNIMTTFICEECFRGDLIPSIFEVVFIISITKDSLNKLFIAISYSPGFFGLITMWEKIIEELCLIKKFSAEWIMMG